MGAGVLENSLSFLKGLWSLWKLIREGNYDVVETFTPDSNVLGMPLAWMGRVPVRMATHHGAIEGLPRWREKLHTWLINHNLANILVTVSERTRQNALQEGIRADHVVVIQNGIAPVSVEGVNRLDVRKEAGVGENDLFLLSVGRLVHQKAHEILVAAMPSVLKQFPHTKVGICGDGFLRPQLDAQIKSLGLEKSVMLLGRFDHVTKFLAAADIFILPSRWEGLPIALLEAMSVGLPVIATRVEGVDEVVADREHGLLVPVEDVAALSDAILQLLQDPQARRKMGMAAKQRLLEAYSIDHMGEKYLSLMVDILKNGTQFR
jgi:glycosyltransferase involved in cell wall biosynthesis